jgi:tetratricopeptide (TPR) repeat protein
VVQFPRLESHLGNVGLEHFQNGRFDVAKKLAESIVQQFPNNQFAWKALGAVFVNSGQLDDALIANKNAVRINPQSAEAHYNLGITLKELGRLDEAVRSYIKAIELNPHMLEPSSNLVDLLTTYAPQKDVSHPIVTADQEIKKIELKEKASGIISDDEIIQLICKSSSIIKRHNLELGTNFTDVFRRNSVDMNCNRHLAIFNKFNVIPKFCFGCYKVQVEPRSLLELIKLFVVFDQIKLVENNARKCLIEIRPKIAGFYKGLIYCSSLQEAYQIADYVEMVVNENIGPGLHATVKRGCSEYPISFPDYKEINKSGAQLMNYNEDWKLIEEEYDSKNPIISGKIIRPSLSCLNLGDILIIRNWIDYAKGVGDPSVHLLNQNTVFSETIYRTAKTRLETYPWRESLRGCIRDNARDSGC